MLGHALRATAGAALGVWLGAAPGLIAQAPTATSPAPAVPSEPVVTWGGEVEVVSTYVWRGFRYSEGPVVWPSAWVAARGFSASLFLNYDRDGNPRCTESDVTFAYERTRGRLTLAGSYARYVYFEGGQTDVTSELIGRADVGIGPGALFTTHAVDIDTYRGSYYAEAGYSVERDLDARSTISADASIAFWSPFIDRYTRGTAVHITDGTIGPLLLNVSYLRTLAPGLAIRPQISFIRIGDAVGRRVLNPPGVTAGLALVIGR